MILKYFTESPLWDSLEVLVQAMHQKSDVPVFEMLQQAFNVHTQMSTITTWAGLEV